MTNDAARRTFVLVHGAFHGAWCWQRVVEQLAAAGVDALAVHLPLTGLLDDGKAVSAAIDAAPGPVTLVGHSYGGAVIGQAGAHPKVDQLIFLAAQVVRDGDCLRDFPGADLHLDEGSYRSPHLNDAMREHSDRLELDWSRAAGIFYSDCTHADAELAASQLRPTGRDCLFEPTTHAAWEHLPSAYVICTADRAFPVTAQVALSARIGVRPYLLQGASHSPFWSRPEETARLLLQIEHDLERDYRRVERW